jgi:hypothetical protein
MVSKMIVGLAAAALVLTAPIAGAATKAGSEKGGGKSATYLKQKPPGAKHKPGAYGYNKGMSKGQ